MPASVIVDVELLSHEHVEAYNALAVPSIQQYGGRYLTSGYVTDVLEGEVAPPERIVVLEFPDIATAKEWYDSPEYRAARDARGTSMRLRMVIIDGPAG